MNTSWQMPRFFALDSPDRFTLTKWSNHAFNQRDRAHLHALAKEDVPDAQRKGEGEGVGEDGDEPLRGVHGRVDALLLEVRAQAREQLLHQPLELEQVLLHQRQPHLHTANTPAHGPGLEATQSVSNKWIAAPIGEALEGIWI